MRSTKWLVGFVLLVVIILRHIDESQVFHGWGILMIISTLMRTLRPRQSHFCDRFLLCQTWLFAIMDEKVVFAHESQRWHLILFTTTRSQLTGLGTFSARPRLDFSGARLIKLNLSLTLDSDVGGALAGGILRTVLSHYDFRWQLTVIIDINNLNFDISYLGRLIG